MWDEVYSKVTNISKSKNEFANRAKQLLEQKKGMNSQQWNSMAKALIAEYERRNHGGKENNHSGGIQGANHQGYDARGLQSRIGSREGGSLQRGSSGIVQRGPNGERISRNGNDHRNGVLVATEESLQIKEVDAASFFHALKTAKEKRFSYDKCVTLHEISDYKNMRCFLSASGQQGFAVAKDGDIVSVFNSNKHIKGATKIMMPMAIKMGGKKLDCYNINNGLLKVYSKFGFVPVVRVPFNRVCNPEFPTRYGTPDVLIMAHNGDSAEKVKQKYGTYDIPKTEDVPIESDYDKAMKMRDDFLEEHRYGSNVKILFKK